MNTIWQIKNLKALILLKQIGFRNGLKSGDRPTDNEFEEVKKRHALWVIKLGHTELSRNEIIKSEADKGKKILHINKDQDGNIKYNLIRKDKNI